MAEGTEPKRSKLEESTQLPSLYFGTMTFGWNQASTPVDDALALSMVDKFLSSGGVEVDTARIYAGGATEPILGRVLQDVNVRSKKYHLATKVHPSQPGGLSSQGIRDQLDASLKALQVDKVDVLYLHQPDPENSLEESLECIHSFVKAGTVGQLGLSNFNAIEVERCCALCKSKEWTMPSVYQGLYNPLNRWTEDDLLPVLRKHGISFVAYNPLAAGLLTGKHTQDGEVLGGRFKDNPNYLPRFYTDANFAALEGIRKACQEHQLSMVPATYSWMLQHSCLNSKLGDGLLLGASSISQLEENLAACSNPVSLPEPVLAAFNGAWAVCRESAFPYWRAYSKDQPNRENLHQGAAYNAAKK